MKMREKADVTPKKQAVAILLVSGFSVVDAAKRTGVGPRTIHNWLCKPEYRAYINRLRDGFIDEALGRLTASATAAVDTLQKLLGSPKDTVRLRAATAILDLLLKVRDHREFAERIGNLEERIGLVDSGLEERPGDQPALAKVG